MKHLSVAGYCTNIDLNAPFVPAQLSDIDDSVLIRDVLNDLTSAWRQLGIKDPSTLSHQDQRRLLDAAITIAPPFSLNAHSKAALDTLLQRERASTTETHVGNLPPFLTLGNTKIVLWRGDITTLNADAIVNAANSQLLGCFLPQHKCIDNAIHNRAGVQLREDCDVLIKLQGHDEPTGIAKITRAYNLPSRYVIHTVGPIVQGAVTSDSKRLLSSSYSSILDTTQTVDNIRSLAFCSISTGVFGYPIEQATPLALKTVAQWVKANPDALDTVVFNVFSEHDYNVYQSALEEFICKN